MRSPLLSCLLLAALCVCCAVPALCSTFPARLDAVSPCRFGAIFDSGELFVSAEVRAVFADAVATWEGQFIQPNPCAPLPEADADENEADLSSIGYHAATGMTLDGHRLAIKTGEPLPGGVHLFTAASKESLHLAILAQALSGNAGAMRFLSPSNPALAPAVALAQLSLKVNTFDTFFATYPGFGGFLPWVYVSNAGIEPTLDFNSSVPSLDNGQMFWGAFAVAHVLSTQYAGVVHTPLPELDEEVYSSPNTTLAARWANIVERMATNALVVFLETRTNTTTGQFRTVAVIADRTLAIDQSNPAKSAQNYASVIPCGSPCFLDDPYEGELFTNAAYLLSNWSWTGASPESVWDVKRAKLQAVNFTAIVDGNYPRNITVERGWWFSGHEKWKYSFMPYVQSGWNRRVFLNGERARTWWSFMNDLPSGFASVTGTAYTDSQDTGYHSDCGIQSIAFESVGNTDIITPYSFAALFLASPPHAFVWYHNYLISAGGHTQTCFGSMEGFNRTGANWSPLVTWDTKMTTFVAMNGGVGSIVSAGLAASAIDEDRLRSFLDARQADDIDQDTLPSTSLDLFLAVVNREWSREFPSLVGEDLDFQLPNALIPDLFGENLSCSDSANSCQCV